MYQIFLGDLLLPIPPSKITTKIKNQNKTITLLNGEEINIINPAGLTEVSFEILLPWQYYPFAIKKCFSPGYYLEKIEELKTSNQPFKLLIDRGPLVKNREARDKKLQEEKDKGKGNKDKEKDKKGKEEKKEKEGEGAEGEKELLFTLEDYTITEDAAEGLDIKVSLQLKQYLPYGTVLAKIKTNDFGMSEGLQNIGIHKKKRPSDKNKIPTTYIVVKGDTLWGIAKKLLGDGAKCWNLAKLNKLPNPNKLTIGQVLRIEDVPASKTPVKTSVTTKKESSTANKGSSGNSGNSGSSGSNGNSGNNGNTTNEGNSTDKIPDGVIDSILSAFDIAANLQKQKNIESTTRFSDQKSYKILDPNVQLF